MDQYKDLHCTLGAMGSHCRVLGREVTMVRLVFRRIFYSFYVENKCKRMLEAGRLAGEARKSLQMLTIAMKLKDACSLEDKLSQT